VTYFADWYEGKVAIHSTEQEPPVEILPYAKTLTDPAVQMLLAGYNDGDPTPWCTGCGAMTKEKCDCLPIAENN
jgi:hypothetical protein